MDKLAGSGVVFTRAYAQMSFCVPSRASFLTGFRPASTGIDDAGLARGSDRTQNFRAARGADFVTLPEHLKRHGWRSVGIGKIFHCKIAQAAESRRAFSEEPYHEEHHRRTTCSFERHDGTWCTKSADEAAYLDAAHTSTALEKLESFAQEPGRPFLLMVGFLLPHGPWAVPPAVWRLYDERHPRMLPTHPAHGSAPRIAWGGNALWEPPLHRDGLPSDLLPGAFELPSQLCRLAGADSAESCCCDDCEATVFPSMQSGKSTARGPMRGGCSSVREWNSKNAEAPDEAAFTPERVQRQARRAYFAAVSFVDAQVGRILGRLSQLGLEESTLVALTSDHGCRAHTYTHLLRISPSTQNLCAPH
jgi:arylsulfatase A-like enzyme